MSLKRFGLTGSLNNQPRVAARKFSSNRISLRRFPFATTPGVVTTAVYVEDVFSTYLYTGNGTTQTISNGIDMSGSIYGGYVEFDGVDDALITTMPALSGDFTVEFFFFPTDFNRAYIILDKSFRDTNFSIVTDYLNTGAFYVQVGAYGQINFSFNPPIVNQWSHVALCRSGSTVRMFLNGTLLSGTTAGVTGAITTGTLYIGAGSSAGSGYEFTQGYISNLRITNTALYTSNFTRPSSPLEAVSGTQLLTCKAPSLTTDLSPNAYSITISGAPISRTEGGVFNDTSKGGLVWIKGRSQVVGHRLVDTARGVTKSLDSSTGAFEASELSGVTAFSNTGFSLSDDVDYNNNASLYASWTFRRQAKFFDVVTYTGNGVASRQISHNLGSVPGCIFIKCTSVGYNWYVYHRSTGSNQVLILNSTLAAASSSAWNNTTPTDTVFTVDGLTPEVNENGATYVAYLFAHDAGGFGLSGSDNIISCGSYIGNGSTTGPTINLGYEPAFLLIKDSTASNDWCLHDGVRGITNTPGSNQTPQIYPNLNVVENLNTRIALLANGFQIIDDGGKINTLNSTFIYIAIRRGPMETPTSGTEVFQPIVYTGTNVDNRKVTTNILTDMIMARQRNSTSFGGMLVGDRLRGNQYLATGTTAAGVTDADSLMTPTSGYGTSFSAMDGFGVGNDATSQLNLSVVSNNQIVEAFRRAPGFLDIVTYTGTGTARTVSHNLGVVPKMIWVKKTAGGTDAWAVYTSALGPNLSLQLDDGGAYSTLATFWNDTAPTSSSFTVGTNGSVNASGHSFVAYLFGDVPSVSKCSYYVGKGVGTSQQIDCGFTAGARLVLIKSTESAGDWYLYDSSRGILSGNDPYFSIETTNTENTSTDYIDPYSAGFEISSTAPADMNSGYGEFYASYPVGGTAVEGAIFHNNQFVVVDSSGQVNFSPDGIRWTTYSTTSGTLRGITFGNELYVACGTNGDITTSSNGTSWSSRTSGTASNLLSCEFAFGKYWACGASGTLLSSSDGINWSSVSTGTTVSLNRIKYLNGVLFIVGSSSRLLQSSDGINFTLTDLGLGNIALRDIVYGKNLYVIGGDSQTLLTSPDGTTWTSRTIGRSPQALVFTGNRFLAGGGSGNTAYSDDGITWTNGPTITAVTFNTAAFGNDIAILFNSQSCISSPRYIYWAIA